MKIKLSLGIIVILQSMGCGALKHSKASTENQGKAAEVTENNVDTPSAKVAIPSSAAVVNPPMNPVMSFAPTPASTPIPFVASIHLNNLESEPRSVLSKDGTRFITIGSMAKHEVENLLINRDGEPLLLGSLRANWHVETCSSHVEGPDPSPAQSNPSVNYPQIQVFFVQNQANPDRISIAIKEEFQPLVQSKSVEIETLYKDEMVCSMIAGIKDVFSNQEIQAPCNGFHQCIYTLPYFNKVISTSYQELLANSPGAKCIKYLSLPTQRKKCTNSSNITSYRIDLNEQFKNIAAILIFEK